MDFEEVQGQRKNSKVFLTTDGHKYIRNNCKADEHLVHAR